MLASAYEARSKNENTPIARGVFEKQLSGASLPSLPSWQSSFSLPYDVNT
jgi:hypothetical protein